VPIEGSGGRSLVISSAGSFLADFPQPAIAERLFGAKESVVAENLRPPQRADAIDGGYRVNGHFRFGSGCHHASVMACGCVVYRDGKPDSTGKREPNIRVMLVPKSKVTIVDVWQTTGMRGTGSNDYLVDNVFVPSEESPSMAEPPFCASGCWWSQPPWPLAWLAVPYWLVCWLACASQLAAQLSLSRSGC